MTYRDQPLRPAEQRTHGLPLHRPDHLPHAAGVAPAMEGGHRGNPRPLGCPECHGRQEVVHPLHMDEVIVPVSDLPDQCRRDVQVSSPGPRRIPTNGQQSLVLDRGQLALEVGGEHREIESLGGNSPRHLVDVSLDSTNVGRVQRSDHGDPRWARTHLRDVSEINHREPVSSAPGWP